MQIWFQILNFFFDIGMIFGPILGYLYQYRSIYFRRNTGIFSIRICGILLFANILRIQFYSFSKYKITLLLQSICMIIMQTLLLQLCTKFNKLKIEQKQQEQYHSRSEETSLKVQKQQKKQKQQFWEWKQFYKYCITIIIFILISTFFAIVCLLLQFYKYGLLLGFISLIFQSVLIGPQIIQNYTKSNVKGLSQLLIGLNFTGDVLKLIYFYINNQPFQFKLCGFIQIFLDIVIIIQILYYRICFQQSDSNGSINSPAQNTRQNQLQNIQQQGKIDDIWQEQIDETGEIQQIKKSKPIESSDHDKIKEFDLYSNNDFQKNTI